jgi:hypothetical protein
MSRAEAIAVTRADRASRRRRTGARSRFPESVAVAINTAPKLQHNIVHLVTSRAGLPEPTAGCPRYSAFRSVLSPEPAPVTGLATASYSSWRRGQFG